MNVGDKKGQSTGDTRLDYASWILLLYFTFKANIKKLIIFYFLKHIQKMQ